MRLNEFLKLLGEAELTELFVPGFVDNDDDALPPGGTMHNPMSDHLYLRFDKRLVHFSANIKQLGMMATFAEKIECSFENDADFGFGVTRMLKFVLQSGRYSARVTKIDAFLGKDSDLEHCIFAALGLMCDSGDYIFFNPLDIDGMHVGSTQARDMWLSHWGTHPNLTFTMRSYDVIDVNAKT